MKKSTIIVSIFLVVVLLLVVLVGVFKDDILGAIYDVILEIEESKEREERSPVKTRNELQITLTKDFEYDFYSGYGSEDVYVSDDHLVGLYTTTIEKITLKDKPAPSLETYASLFFPIWVGLKGYESIPLDRIEDMLCYEADLNQDGDPDNIVFFLESETSFYFVRMTFNRNTTTYEESRDQFIEWAKTITLN